MLSAINTSKISLSEVTTMKFNTAYKPNELKTRRPIITVNDKPTMTKAALIDDADINKLIKRHGVTHVVQNMSNLEALYGEITSKDLQEAQQLNIDAHNAFMELPSDFRKRFGNDAGACIDYMTNPDNLKEMQALGFAKPPAPPEEPIKVQIANPETGEAGEA